MTTPSELPVNFNSVARLLYRILCGEGVNHLQVYSLQNGKLAVPVDDDLLRAYVPQPGFRPPSAQEMIKSLRGGTLSEMGFFVFSDNLSRIMISTKDGVDKPTNQDFPFDAEKFSRFAKFLFSPKKRFTKQEAKDFVYDTDTTSCLVLNEVLIAKFRVIKGTRRPTIAEAKEFFSTAQEPKYKLVELSEPFEGYYGVSPIY